MLNLNELDGLIDVLVEAVLLEMESDRGDETVKRKDTKNIGDQDD